MFFSCILEGNTSFLRSFIDYDLKDKSYREVKKERSASFTFELDILDNLDNPDVIDELLDLRIKEENSYLYLLDNLYIDKKDIPFSKEDYFISVNKNFLNKKNNNLKEGLEIKKTTQDKIDIPILKVKYRYQEKEEWLNNREVLDNESIYDFLRRTLNLDNIKDYYGKLYIFEAIPPSYIYNIRLDFYDYLSNIEPIYNKNTNSYKASSLKLVNTSYIYIKYKENPSLVVNLDNIEVNITKKDDKLISIVTFGILMLSMIGILTIKEAL